ncbi:MAG: hypothetical protein H7A51_16325 [Akkermansiaceae bacterium]|nr:hypothetical protein [Akkermansiaceae bacterium]
MAKTSLKPIGLLVLPLLFSASLQAQTVTDPVGVVKITIAGAPSVGQSKLTAISATLRGAIEHQGTATSVGSFATNSQPLNTGVTTWTAAQWTTVPHLCYIENAAGAEEAYLITGMDETTGVLTLSTTFDFTARYTSTPTYRICKAQTLAGIFSNLTINGSPGNFHGDDRIFLWDGSSWNSYSYDGSQWVNVLDPFTSANDTVVFPSEGIFVKRTQTANITITVNGSVPTTPQVSTIPGPGLTFISSNYPVGTTFSTMALQNTNAWGGDDRMFIWNGSSWDSFLYDGSNWVNVLDPFTPVDNNPIAPDSAIFVKRNSTSTKVDSAASNPLPYTP